MDLACLDGCRHHLSQDTDKGDLFENFDTKAVGNGRPGQKQNSGRDVHTHLSLLLYEPQPKGVETSYDGKTNTVDRKLDGAKFPQVIRMGKQPPHAFENKDNFPAHYYRVEFKKINYKG